MGGYGLSFRKWFKSGEGPCDSYGNGSAMRVSPITWYFDNRDGVLKAAK